MRFSVGHSAIWRAPCDTQHAHTRANEQAPSEVRSAPMGSCQPCFATQHRSACRLGPFEWAKQCMQCPMYVYVSTCMFLRTSRQPATGAPVAGRRATTSDIAPAPRDTTAKLMAAVASAASAARLAPALVRLVKTSAQRHHTGRQFCRGDSCDSGIRVNLQVPTSVSVRQALAARRAWWQPTAATPSRRALAPVAHPAQRGPQG